MRVLLKIVKQLFFIENIKSLVLLQKIPFFELNGRNKIIEFIGAHKIKVFSKGSYRIGSKTQKSASSPSSLCYYFWKTYDSDISKCFILLTVDNMVKIIYSIILANLIGVLDTCALRDLLFWGVFLISAIMLHVFLGQHNWNLMNKINCNFKHFIVKLLLGKIKKINPFTISKIDQGKLVNILSGEIKVSNILAVFAAPGTAGVCFLLLYQNYRLTSLYCLVFLILIYFFQSFIMKSNARFIKARAEITDKKLRLISDILLGRQTIILNSWEEAMQDMVHDLRKAEEVYAKRVLEVNFFNKIVSGCTPVAMSLILFFLHPNSMTLSLIIATLQLINHMSISIIFYVGSGISTIYEVITVFTRLAEIMNLPERTSFLTSEESVLNNKHSILLSLRNNSVFRTEDHTGIPVLEIKKLTIEANKKYAVIGDTSSGKTIFLKSLIQQAPYSAAVIRRKKDLKISYMEQEPFIFSGTLKENILLGAQFNEKRFLQVIKITCLDHDFERIGENILNFQLAASGGNLSKGQRIRVSLARTLYREADIYALDDPFSSLDSKIAERVLINLNCMWTKKTFLIITNIKPLLSEFDKILSIGKCSLQQINSPTKTKTFASEDIDKISQPQPSREKSDEQSCNQPGEQSCNQPGEQTFKQPAGEQSSMQSEGRANEQSWKHPGEQSCKQPDGQSGKKFQGQFNKHPSEKAEKRPDEKPEIQPGKQFEEPGHCKNARKTDKTENKFQKSEIDHLNLIKKYLLYGKSNYGFLGFVLFLFILSETIKLGFFNKVAQLSKNPHEKNSLIIYFLLHVAVSVVKNEIFYQYMIKRSTKLHLDLLKTKLLSCFELKSPLEGTLSRFSSDIPKLDQEFIIILRDFLELLVNYICLLTLAIYAVPMILVSAFLAFMLIFTLYSFSQATISNIKKMEIEYKSKTITDFLNIIKGFSTLSAFNQKRRFLEDLNKTSEFYIKCSHIFWGLNRLLYFYLELIGTILTSIMILTLLLNKFILDNNVLLSQCITNTITLSEIIQFNFTLFFQLKIFTLNIENVFLDIDSSGISQIMKTSNCDQDLHSHDTETTFLRSGKIAFNKVTLKYKNAAKPILFDLNFEISHGEKIVILGRTGAGKTTLTRAILASECIEIVGAEQTFIKIDDLDIKSLSVKNLRRNISIITQEPFFFTGTLRDNIDPLKIHSDKAILEALSLFKLDSYAHILNKNINNSFLTTGEKQLLNLCRLALQKSKIIILDEAVSFLDTEKQKEVMCILGEHVFPNATVIKIIHRLEGNFEYSKVFRLDEEGRMDIRKII